MGKTEIKKINYKGWPGSYHISNGSIELVATTAVGPRIIRLGFPGKENEFCEVESMSGTSGAAEWQIYGGHRLWHSPEHMPRTYELDNSPIDSKKIKNGVRLTQPMEKWTQLTKEIEITMSPDSNKVNVLHRITNNGAWEIELAIWALSVMAPGGREVVPQITRDTGLLPNRMISLWPYSKMNDRRVYWGDKYIFLDQDVKATTPFKVGLPNEGGWAAYFNRDRLFVKSFDYYDEAVYPDFGASSYETYTNDFMCEMESLSPLALIKSGETIEHEETWHLFENVTAPKNEQEADEILLPIIDGIKSK